MKRKIDAMHQAYGTSPDLCRNCRHFARNTYGRTYFKCLAYGDSAATSTDWKAGYMACGLFNRPLPEPFVPMIEMLKHAERKTPGEPLEGQITLDDLLQ